MLLTKKEFAKMVDYVDLRANTTQEDIRRLVEEAVLHHFIAIACTKSYNPFAFQVLDELGKHDELIIVGGAGFPLGGDKTFSKVAAVRDCIADGCQEIDITCNIGFIKSHLYEKVEKEMRMIVDAADGRPVKFIIEVSYLTNDEIKYMSEAVVRCGGSFVKTGTGWGPGPTTLEHVKLIKSIVGNSIGIKASAGIRTLEKVIAMKEAGATRFGISRESALAILDQLPNA